MVTCKLTDCPNTSRSRFGYCTTHVRQLKNWGTFEKPNTYRRQREQFLSKYPQDGIVVVGDNWYSHVHKWMKIYHGKADHCEMETCQGRSQTYQWANLTGKYLRDRSDWKMMCASCHQLYDRGNHCRHGHELNPESVWINPKTNARVCRQCSAVARKKYWNKNREALLAKKWAK